MRARHLGTITDPSGGGWYTSAVPDGEICDLCLGSYTQISVPPLDGWGSTSGVAAVWSNAAGACVSSPAAAAAPDHARPTRPGRGAR